MVPGVGHGLDLLWTAASPQEGRDGMAHMRPLKIYTAVLQPPQGELGVCFLEGEQETSSRGSALSGIRHGLVTI